MVLRQTRNPCFSCAAEHHDQQHCPTSVHGTRSDELVVYLRFLSCDWLADQWLHSGSIQTQILAPTSDLTCIMRSERCQGTHEFSKSSILHLPSWVHISYFGITTSSDAFPLKIDAPEAYSRQNPCRHWLSSKYETLLRGRITTEQPAASMTTTPETHFKEVQTASRPFFECTHEPCTGLKLSFLDRTWTQKEIRRS